MRLYCIFNTPLADLHGLSDAPGKNDVVIYIRHAQDQFGTEKKRLKKKGVEVLFLEDLMDQEATGEADAIGTEFLKSWFMKDGQDFSLLKDVSLGVALSTEIGGKLFPRLLLRIGEALRRGLQLNPMVEEVLSDAQNGCCITKLDPAVYPLAEIVALVTRHEGKSIRFFEPVNPFAHHLEQPSRHNLKFVIHRFLGGFRISWLKATLARIRRRLANPDKPVLYMFVGRDQHTVTERLAESGKFIVVCNTLGIPDTDALRSDHLFALPSIEDIRIVRNLLREVDKRSSNENGANLFVFHGIDYSAVLYQATSSILQAQIWAFLFVVAQSRKLQLVTGASVLVINDAGAEPMGNLVSINRHTDTKIYLMVHGMNQTRYAYFSPAVDHPHVDYLAYGTDHADFFRHNSKKEDKLKTHLVGNPLTLAMNGVRLKRSIEHKKRLLILTFTSFEAWLSMRVYAIDKYYTDIFSILGELINEGWSVTIRTHPGHGHPLEDRLIASFGLDGLIQWDDEPTFADALPKYDVVVSNLTTAYYQSLYAGWPTIFYEPNYRKIAGNESIETDPMMTGLLTARDLDRPVTTDPQTLQNFIRDTIDPDSMVSTFPARIVEELSPRFIGPDPEHADKVIANCIVDNFVER